MNIFSIDNVNCIQSALHEVEEYVKHQNLYAAGFICYEAAPAFDPALKTHRLENFPLLWFGLYHSPQILTSLPNRKGSLTYIDWSLDVGSKAYNSTIKKIRVFLEDGDTYQVNYTLRMQAKYANDPFELFLHMTASQNSQYSAFINLNDHAICCASPELFFELDGSNLISKPMKGTAPRGKNLEEDRSISEILKKSQKNRAENLMIVDMMRNDMGRIAITGSVSVPSLFDVEKYPTVWQMTSTVTAKTNAPVADIFKALFPCASVTGAPKPHTMEIIHQLEPSPRKIYTGSIGMIAPDRRARFNVAIRTILVNRKSEQAEYGVGGGIVWDSAADEEYHECKVKARVLSERRPDFQLIESMLWTPDQGYYLLNYHLKRLSDSALYFDYIMHSDQILSSLKKAALDFPKKPFKVRLLLNEDGSFIITHEAPKSSLAVTLRLAKTPVFSDNIFLYHKTTFRDMYIQALSENDDADDVILWNERQEITEASSSNIVVKIGNDYLTPPVSCGLLAGTRRAELLDQEKIRETIIPKSQLKQADGIFLINSVRPWRAATFLT